MGLGGGKLGGSPSGNELSPFSFPPHTLFLVLTLCPSGVRGEAESVGGDSCLGPRLSLGSYNDYSHNHFILAALLSLMVLVSGILAGSRFSAAGFSFFLLILPFHLYWIVFYVGGL